MAEILYTVCCRISDTDQANKWVSWMVEKHLADVVSAGAQQATLVKMDDESETDKPGSDAVRYEARYRFENREAFDDYIKEHAPGLRAEGLRLFPLELGFVYQRTVGTAVCERSV